MSMHSWQWIAGCNAPKVCVVLRVPPHVECEGSSTTQSYFGIRLLAVNPPNRRPNGVPEARLSDQTDGYKWDLVGNT